MEPGAGRAEGGSGLKVDARRILDRRREAQQAFLDRAERFATSVGRAPGILAVVVFGSVARGDFNVWSDVDVLVVMAEVDDRSVERARSAGREIGLVEPVVWTPEHLRTQLGRQDPIAVESLGRGIWILGAPEDLLGTPPPAFGRQ